MSTDSRATRETQFVAWRRDRLAAAGFPLPLAVARRTRRTPRRALADRARRARLPAGARGPHHCSPRRGACGVTAATLQSVSTVPSASGELVERRPASTRSRANGCAAFTRRARCGRTRSRGCTGCSLRAASFEVARRRPSLPHLRGNDLDDIANQAADDALVSVLRRLDDYRGDSRFTTWVVQVRPARGGGEAADAIVAGARGAARARELDRLLEHRPGARRGAGAGRVAGDAPAGGRRRPDAAPANGARRAGA